MTQHIEVRSQEEFEACVEAGNIAVVIGCSVVARENSHVVALGNSHVVARSNSSVVALDNSSVEACGNSHVVARGNSSVEVLDNSSVEAWGNSHVVALGNSNVVARVNSSVEAWGNSHVVALGNSNVVARGNSSVEARENSSVEAWGNNSVVACGSAFIRVYSVLRLRASAWVTIVIHDQQYASKVEGGRCLDAAPLPETGVDWCEYYGIDLATCDFIVPDIDAKILAGIRAEKIKFDMGSWHGDVACNEANWCETTHCRAGAAVCLAGAPGWALEKKYGAEMAGSMIYAASRPDKPLPDFHATNEDALVDMEQGAAR